MALRLVLSVRQVKRLVLGYCEQGVQGLVSQRRGQPSKHRIDEHERTRILGLVREHYTDFGPTLAAEYLRQHGFTHSVETLRQWMVEVKLWRAKLGPKKRAHPPRLHRPRLGELIQIDGSVHVGSKDGRGDVACLFLLMLRRLACCMPVLRRVNQPMPIGRRYLPT